MDHAGLHLSGCCTTPTKERKLAVAKPKLTTANSPNEHEDEVVNIGDYNINDDTTSMMTDVVKPSTETPEEPPPCRNFQEYFHKVGVDVARERNDEEGC